MAIYKGGVKAHSLAALSMAAIVAPFPALPLELVRDIFEHAACSSRPAARALALVNHTTRSWTDPVLYRTVVLDSARALRAFSCAIATKPADFLPRHLKHLGIFAPGPLPTIYRVLAACAHAGLASLACGFALPALVPHEPRAPIALPRLREHHLLGAACRDPSDWDPSVLSPALTHLRIHITAANWSPARLAGLRRLPSLTHLAVVYRQSDGCFAFILSLLRDILDALPLRLLLVQIVGRPRGACLVERLNQVAVEKLGERRLVAEAAPFSTVRQWEDASRGGVSMWTRAEQEAERRRADAPCAAGRR